jgi:hypothetical protein
MTSKDVGTALPTGTFNNATSTGSIKNPPPAPKTPLTSPIANPNPATFKGGVSSWLSGMVGRSILTPMTIIIAAKTNKNHLSFGCPSISAGKFGTTHSLADNAPIMEGIASCNAVCHSDSFLTSP